MVKITVGNNVSRETKIVDSNTTLRTILEEADIEYGRSAVHLDGASIRPGDLDKTLDELGVTERAYILAVQKADNAR